MAAQKVGTDLDNTISVEAGELPGGIFDGLGGTDTLQLTGDTSGPYALRFNLDSASTLANFEIIRGTTTTDYIRLTSAEFATIGTFDAGGDSYQDYIEIQGATVALKNKTFIGGATRIRLLTDGAEVTVANVEDAFKVLTTGSAREFLKIEGVTLTSAQRKELHEYGYDRIIDGSGAPASYDNAPVLAGLGGDNVAVASGQIVRVDKGLDAILSEEYGIYSMHVTLSGVRDNGRLDVATSDSVVISGTSIQQVFVDGIEIGTLLNWTSRLIFQFNAAATSTRVQELIRAITYQNSSAALPYGQREIEWEIKDKGWRTTTVSSFVQHANNAPTDIALSSAQIAENAAAGTVVATITGTDPNAGDRLSFSLVDNAGGRFAINARGELVVADGSKLDYELASSHTVTIQATDRGNLTFTKTLTITVANVAEGLTPHPADNNVVRGTKGKDIISTGPGADLLIGASGADKLYGGSGPDLFQYVSVKDSTVAVSGRDTIFDFSRAEKDKISLSAIDSNTRKAGNQAFSFIGTKPFHQVSGELRYEKAKGGLIVSGDVNGDGLADFSIFLKSVATLSKSDFVL